MKTKFTKTIFIILLAFFGKVIHAEINSDTIKYTLENDKVIMGVIVQNGELLYDNLKIKHEWCKQFNNSTPTNIETDGDFSIDVMYTDWSAPGKVNNAENPVYLTKKDFLFTDYLKTTNANNSKELILNFKGKETSINLQIIYHLDNDAFYVKRKIAVMDTAFGHHFLRWFWTRSGAVKGISSIIKAGGFGQPIAALIKSGGAFFGVEYPAAENHISTSGKIFNISCGQEYGELIGNNWLYSDWVVEGITPNQFVKYWFFEYLNDIRVVPLRPYSLYNTWYDLRSPEYPNWSSEKVMSEKSALKMVEILRHSMIEKYNIKLDAFVLDDGWDVYESDWVMRKEQWPNGLKPLADELKKTNTSLGVWFGPTGGYSFRMKRVNWMKDHGYEVVGKSRDNLMLCIAGKNYSKLFEKRVTDFVVDEGVGYYKWDGIQFSCSEPNHGHPIDIYSRRAVMESIAEKCRIVREKNPNIFLNITSGTWLSPWWIKYANTIWMQGMDYGFADVPSISQRDGAITYRDFVLYDDFKQQNFWFPIANLMTHGIIKGKHESVGTETEPLDKFTDDVLLYFARGVSMYELYISPDILTDGEWTSISKAMSWARDRFPVLMNTEMVGGNPLKGEAYAYLHFKDKHGIIAARNPIIEPQKLSIKLDPAFGINPKLSGIVLEKIYPTKWISSKIYKVGETITLSLDGFETAVYEIYPLDEATVPLIAGTNYDFALSGIDYTIRYYNTSSDVKLLNPSVINSVYLNGKIVDTKSLNLKSSKSKVIASGIEVKQDVSNKSIIHTKFKIEQDSKNAMLALLLTPDSTIKSKTKPVITASVNQKDEKVKTEPQEGKSQWYLINVEQGTQNITIQIKPGENEKEWHGKASLWLIAMQKQDIGELTFKLKSQPDIKPQAPRVWETGEIRKNLKIGEFKIFTK